MMLIQGYCVVLTLLVAVAGILESDISVPRRTRARIAVNVLGMSGKRHIYREQRILDILKQIGD